MQYLWVLSGLLGNQEKTKAAAANVVANKGLQELGFLGFCDIY